MEKEQTLEHLVELIMKGLKRADGRQVIGGQPFDVSAYSVGTSLIRVDLNLPKREV